MKVHIPTPLQSYTGQKREVEASGETLGDLLWELDRRYPGFRFRIVDEQDGIRQHIKVFVNEEQVKNLSVPLNSTDVLHIICALSGG